MISTVIVKALSRKAAASVSRYNHDERHPDHKDRTDIMEDYTFKSPALEEYGEWKKLDDYENNNQKTDTKNNTCREYIISLPNSWAGDDQKIDELKDRLLNYICDVTGFTRETMMAEMVFHYNHAKNPDQDNFHVHMMVGERELVKEKRQKVYKRDFWQDKTTGKMCKPGAPGGVCVHKKGDLKFDKLGNPEYESNGQTHLSVKNEVFKDKVFLEDMKYQVKEIFETLDNTQKMTVGKKTPYSVPLIDYTDQEMRLNPDRVAVIKEINMGRRVINNNLSDGVKSGAITKQEAQNMADKYKSDIAVVKSTRGKDQGKLSYLEEIRDVTFTHAMRIHDWVYEKIEELRNAFAHVFGRDDSVERTRSFHR